MCRSLDNPCQPLPDLKLAFEYARTPLGAHSDFFNTHACSQQSSPVKVLSLGEGSVLEERIH
jgi:hypothetical protein